MIRVAKYFKHKLPYIQSLLNMGGENDINVTQNVLTCEQLKMEKWGYMIKTFVAAVCLGLFFANNFVLIKEFASQRTIVATNYVERDLLHLPSITVCNASAYKKSRVPTVDLEYYLNNTFQLSNSLISIVSGSSGGAVGTSDEDEILYNLTYKAPYIHIKSLYSYYRGHCYQIMYTRRVS